MEITLEAIISLVGLFVGGGVGSVFTWRYQRKKAKAEAQQAENEAKQTEANAAKELQDVYQQLIEDVKNDRNEQKEYIAELKSDRQHLRQDRDQLRDRLDKTDDDIRTLKREVARTGRQVEMMRPFVCADLGCKQRQRVADISELEHTKQTVGNDIDPIATDAL